MYNELPENDHILGRIFKEDEKILTSKQGTMDKSDVKMESVDKLFYDYDEGLQMNRGILGINLVQTAT